MLAVQFAAASGYEQEIRRWRTEREQRLKAEDGWLSLVGLFWLREGENPVGSDENARVQLPTGFPARAGAIVKSGSQVRWEPAGGAPRELKTDKSGKPDVFTAGRIRMTVIERGTKLGVRMRDNESATRRNFRGLNWYPVDPSWLVRARFIVQPKKMLFDAQAGDKQEMVSPGYVEWQRGGRRLRLTPVTEGDQLFFVFRDKTAGKTTYGAARFLYTETAQNGIVVLDFNKAYNPPCVFTPYATCPLPPPENRLPVAVEAGEKMYAAH